MRIVYDNIIDNYSSLTSDNPEASYPIANIQDEFLKIFYKSSSTTDSIDITLDSGYDADCLAFSYHNLTSLVARFYDLSDTLLHTETVSSPRSGEMVYFTTVESIKRIEIDLTSSANCYIGCIYIGEYIEMPFQSTTPAFKHNINSFTYQSSGGQATGQKRALLKGCTGSYIAIAQSEYDVVETFLESVMNVDKFYLDRWENSTTMNPYYAKVNGDSFTWTQDGYGGVTYSGSIDFIECR